MESRNNNGLVSNYAMVQFFLQQLFKENLIDTDTYVFAMNMDKFNGGDYIFRIIQSLINIISPLAVSAAAAIIFYYVVEFIYVRKRLEDI